MIYKVGNHVLCNNDDFVSFFLICVPFINFPCLITLARISNTVLTLVSIDILTLFLILWGKKFSLTVKYDFNLKYFVCFRYLYQVKKFLSIPSLLSFKHEWELNLTKLFYLCWKITEFPLQVSHSDGIVDFWISVQSNIPGINLHLVMI